MALVTAVIAWGDEKGLLPSEAWDKYTTHKRDFAILFEFRAYKRQREKDEQEKAEAEAKSKARRGRR